MKKKIIQSLLALTTFSSICMLEATAVNKTFMMSRGSISNNTLISKTGCMRNRIRKGKLGCTLAAAAFYRQSYNNTKLAQYFGDGTSANPSAMIDVALGSGVTTGLVSGQIDVQSTSSSDNTHEMYGTVLLNPQRLEMGAQLQWNQSLGNFVDGLWASVSSAIVYVRTHTGATYANAVANSLATAAKGGGKGLSDFFGGKSLDKTIPVTQDALTKQVLTTTNNSTTEVADVRCALGYTLLKEKDYRMDASINALIPTGTKPTGSVAFEPNVGNRSVFIGGGLSAQFNLWRSDDKSSSVSMRAGFDYNYGFGAQQIRTIGMTNTSSGDVAQGQYSLVGSNGTTHTMPLANVSTLAVSVVPGSRLESIVGFCYRHNRFTANVTYNLFYTQQESLTLKGSWNNTQYANIVSSGFVTGSGSPAFTAGTSAFNFSATADYYATPVTVGNPILNPGNTAGTYALDLDTATTPIQVIHKVGIDTGYRFQFSMPVHTAIGAEVDLSSNNTSVNSWAVWAKLGFSF